MEEEKKNVCHGSISICMIVKNEEKYIESCLKAVKPLGYEIIIVDTGSTDRTKEIAWQYTDKVYDFQWINDFSAARNFSIQKAKNDFVLIIDSDEILVDFDKKVLENVVKNNADGIGRLIIINEFTRNNNIFKGYKRVSRLFNRNYYYYEGIIHEQIVSERYEGKFYDIPLILEHNGYEGTIEVRRKKTQRNIELLKVQLEKEADDSKNVPYILYQIGKSYYMQEDYKEASEYFSKVLCYDLDIRLEYVRDAVETYGYALLETKQYKTAMGLLGVYQEFSSSTDFVFLCGLIYMNNGYFNEAIKEFEEAASRQTFKMEGVNGYMAWYNIGVIYECLGKKEKAREYYKKCKNYNLALEGLERL